jgi:DNA repair ATPase RecN
MCWALVSWCVHAPIFDIVNLLIFHPAFFICERCESISSDSDAKNDDHKWWHSLLVLRKSLIEPVLETTSSEVETTGTQAEARSAAVDSDLLPDDNKPDTNPHSALISGVVTRISAVEDKLHVAHTVLENKVDSTKVALEGQLGSIEERVVKLDDIEKRVVKMDDIEKKLDGMEKKLDDIANSVAKLDDIEKRVINLDDIEERVVKLDDKITELTKMLGDLIGRLNI